MWKNPDKEYVDVMILIRKRIYPYPCSLRSCACAHILFRKKTGFGKTTFFLRPFL